MQAMVMLIEDDPITAALVERQLGREGYQVLVASNGVKGLKMIRDHSPDLLLLDLMLPGLDGFEVLSRLRGDPQTADMPVVIVSAKSRPADRQMASRIGADAYLTKPYNKEELLALVRSLTSQKPKQAATRGIGVLLVAPHGGEAASVALHTGLALVSKGQAVTVVDFRPLSVAHCLLLEVPPRQDVASLPDLGTMGKLAELTVQHPSGLRLLNNLEGTGAVGQFTAKDVEAVLNVLMVQEGFVLADIPLYSIDVLFQTAAQCAQTLVVAGSDPVSLGAMRSTLTMMQRAGVDAERVGIVLLGSPAEKHMAEWGQSVLGTLPAETGPNDPTFHTLADRLLSLA